MANCMDIVTQINNNIYPNALAKLRFSTQDMSVVDISHELKQTEILIDDINMAKKNNKKTTDESTSTIDSSNVNAEVDMIWKSLGLGKIDLSYACIGYAYTGQMILLHDDLVSLLINYGFTINAILAFIEDFAKNAENDKNAPIIMHSKNNAFIMTDIEPIVEK